MSRGPFLERPGNFSGPSSHSKISNLAITELCYSHILKMKGVPHIQEVSGLYTSPFLDTDERKMAFINLTEITLPCILLSVNLETPYI